MDIPAKKNISFGMNSVRNINLDNGISFDLKETRFNLNLAGEFNIYNAMAAICVAKGYGIDMGVCKKQAGNQSVFNFLSGLIQNSIEYPITSVNTVSRSIKIPVCYDPSVAPDIALLAELHSISEEELIEVHTGKNYRVYMIGFLPGFAYMGTVDKRIATPRKSVPRTFVPAGSVGIAGEQTGIYPFGSAGGWQLIGRTPITMFNPANENPCYLQPGDEVKFFPITLSEYKNWGSHEYTH